MSKLAYKEIHPEGEKTVLLLHGLGANSNSWQYQWSVLANAGYRVIIPDFEGFGETGYAKGPMTIKSMSNDIYDLLKELRIQKVNICGLSMGGAVAQQFALDHPVITDRLILSNTASCFMSRKGGVFYFFPRYILFRVTPPIVRAKVISKIIFPFPDQQEYRAEFIDEIMQAHPGAYMKAAANLIKFDLREAIHRIKAPTLIISGKLDKTTPLYLQEFLHQEIKGSRHIILAGGHVTSIDSQADFNKEMLDFLSK
jgi:pimeloyl-ACP methyl ester carboxylesterase